MKEINAIVTGTCQGRRWIAEEEGERSQSNSGMVKTPMAISNGESAD